MPGSRTDTAIVRVRGGGSVRSPLAVQRFLVLARDAGDAQRRTARLDADPLDAAGIEHMPHQRVARATGRRAPR
jgi:hypothetical protein